jgi:uncharacterized membrane protein YuzA (DUF378 family)
MATSSYLAPHEIERYSFLWSQTRLLIAAAALFMGGVPPAYVLFRNAALYVIVAPLLRLAWIISGAASAYLLYRWNANRQMVFGGKAQKDIIAFFISIVSGLNLGITGLMGINIGMSVFHGSLIYMVAAVLYVFAFIQLLNRWNASGKKMF